MSCVVRFNFTGRYASVAEALSAIDTFCREQDAVAETREFSLSVLPGTSTSASDSLAIKKSALNPQSVLPGARAAAVAAAEPAVISPFLDGVLAAAASPFTAEEHAADPCATPPAVDPTPTAEVPKLEELQRVVPLAIAQHPAARARIKALVTEAGGSSLSTIPAAARADFLATLSKEFPLG